MSSDRSDLRPQDDHDEEHDMFRGMDEADRETVRRRAARLSALLDADQPDAEMIRRSADAMRPHVVGARPEHVERTSGDRTGQRRDRTGQRRSYHVPALRAAVVVLLLAAGALVVVPPARAWVVQQAQTLSQSLAQMLGLAERDSPVVPAQTDGTAGQQPQTAAAVRVTFAATPGTLHVTAAVTTGTLALRQHDAVDATAEAVNATGVRFVVLPDGLRIEGPSHSEAEYLLTVPSGVQQVRLTHADGVVTPLPVPGRGGELQVLLRP